MFDPELSTPRLIYKRREECHVDQIERRASTILWITALPEPQDMVIVRRADTGREIHRKLRGWARHAWQNQVIRK